MDMMVVMVMVMVMVVNAGLYLQARASVRFEGGGPVVQLRVCHQLH
jgi:hypothetical protein